MRERADEERIRAFLRELGRRARVAGRVYLVGGTTAVLEGWRSSTVDVDLRFEPDDDALLRSLPELKERLDLNVELVSPPGSSSRRSRSSSSSRSGPISFATPPSTKPRSWPR